MRLVAASDLLSIRRLFESGCMPKVMQNFFYSPEIKSEPFVFAPVVSFRFSSFLKAGCSSIRQR